MHRKQFSLHRNEGISNLRDKGKRKEFAKKWIPRLLVEESNWSLEPLKMRLMSFGFCCL